VTLPLDPAQALAAFPDRPGAYLHVPFCEQLCPFCPYDKVRWQADRVAPYFAALHRELDLWLPHLQAPFRSLYVGGGTPTCCLDELEPVLARLPVEGERAIELLPTHASPERVERLRELGIGAVSVGVQSFDDAVLHHLGRPMCAADNLRALDAVAGRFDCVDVDLIFDVAFAAPEVLLRDLETCFARGVDQVSTYPLMRFAYTPFGAAPHAAAQEHALLHRAEELAERHGYRRAAVWTFVRPGGPRYSSITRELFLGLGASAASFSGRRFWVNHFSPERYAEPLAQGALPVARQIELPGPLGPLYWMFWQAYAGRVDLRRLEPLFGTSRAVQAVAAGLVDIGWATREEGGQTITLSPRGRDVYHDLEREVTTHLIEPLWADLMAEHDPADHPPPTPRGGPVAWVGRRARRRWAWFPG